MSVAHDKNQIMRVEKFTCAARRAIAIEERKDREAHKNDHKLDGVNYYAVPHDG